MKLTYKCPICNKNLVLLTQHTLVDPSAPRDKLTLNEYRCGHIFSKHVEGIDVSTLNLTSTDGEKHAREYQKDGVKFIVESGFNCIIADQMRLGKTPQSLLALTNKYPDMTPCLILVRSANLWQWVREYKIWCDSLPLGIFPIANGTKSFIPPGFSAYIISMDTFSRPAMLAQLKTIDWKLVIADEAHSFKNTDSNRSQALVDFIREKNFVKYNETIVCQRCERLLPEGFKYGIHDPNTTNEKGETGCGQWTYPVRHQELETIRKCGLILLTGTPIKNRAEEYYVLLNLVAPEKFSSLESFRRTWLEQDAKGRWSRVQPRKLDAFKETIAPYVLRREKEDVFTDLPKLDRIFTVIEPEKDQLTKLYNKMLDKMEAKLAEKADPSYWDMADDLMELRRICGMMKLPWTADYAEASLMDSDNQRLAIGIHHHSVRDVLSYKLAPYGVLKLSGEDNAEKKDYIMRNFATSPERILIINMLAGGVGMDFHYCNNVLVLERQWSPADEEQFEFRFYNPDKTINPEPTRVEYIIAKGTIDEWWYDMVESKRRIFGETIATHWEGVTDQETFRELIQKTVSGRL